MSEINDYVEEGAFLDSVPPRKSGVPDFLLDAHGRPFGPPLSKLTPWRHHMLLGHNSPFVTGSLCRRSHLWQALYFCSPAFRSGSRTAFLVYQLRTFWFVTFRFQAAAIALTKWLDAHFAAMPPMPVAKKDGAGERPEAGLHWLISLMQLGRLAGFNPLDVIHLPYPVLWASVDSVLSANDNDRPKFNRERDKKRGEYLRAKKAGRGKS